MLRELTRRFRQSLHTVRTDEISRRYFVLNSFDGALTTLAIIMGAYFAGVETVRIILVAVLGANVAMGVSGAWGAYMSERAERIRSIKELETALFTTLHGTVIERASKSAVLFIALIDALAPVMSSLICISPLLLSSYGLATVGTTVWLAFLMAIAVLFSLGLFLGRISRTNIWFQGGSMILAGLFVLIVTYIFGMA